MNCADPLNELKLDKAFTVFMIPFHFSCELKTLHQALTQQGVWQLQRGKISQEPAEAEVLYPHIMSFLQGEMRESDIGGDRIMRYCLGGSDATPFDKRWHRLTHEASAITGSDLSFRLLDSQAADFTSPHILLWGVAQIGILTFALAPEPCALTVDRLTQLNYSLHRFDNPPTCQCEELTWTMPALVSSLLQGLGLPVTPFSAMRPHLFTYCQTHESNDGALRLTWRRLLPAVVRLSRCQSQGFMLDPSRPEVQNCCLPIFANISVASSVEGTAMMAVPHEVNRRFIDHMHLTVRLRYVWIYILAVLQRYAMLNLNRALAQDEAAMSKEQLRHAYDVMRKVLLHCHYSDISSYTHHTQFYRHCCRCLHVDDAYHEASQKTALLSQTISQRAQEDADERQRDLNIVVAILAVSQVGDAIFGLVNCEPGDNTFWPIASMVISAALIVAILIIPQKELFLRLWSRIAHKTERPGKARQ